MLDAGKIVSETSSQRLWKLSLDVPQVEFATPAELLAIPGGIFKSLVDESGDKQHLYEIAGRL